MGEEATADSASTTFDATFSEGAAERSAADIPAEDYPVNTRLAGDWAKDHSDDDGNDSNNRSIITTAIADVEAATRNTARLSWQTEKALLTALASTEVASEAGADAIVLSDQINTYNYSTSVRVRRVSNHVAAVRAKAGAIAGFFREKSELSPQY